jgi:hypothetical protein
MTTVPRGRFCWHDLNTTDPDGAQAFYSKVIGWSTMPWEGEEPYTMWTTTDGPIGGMMALPQAAKDAGAPTHWISYVSTPDLDATLTRAQALGGTLVWGPEDVPEVGRIAGLADRQGAHFALFQPSGDSPGSDEPARVGEASWHELATDAWEDAWAFYSELFDWEKTEAMDMGELGMYQMFGRGAHPLGAMYPRPPEIPVSNWLVYVRVPDVAAAVERVKEAGGQLLVGPMEVPGGDIIAQCMDPQGGVFAVHATVPAN